MKRYWKLPVLISLYLLLCSKSCNDREQDGLDVEQAAVTTTGDSIRKLYEARTISDEMIPVFEESARQKLANLGDYLAIYHDTAAAPAFRERAGKMIRNLFMSEGSFEAVTAQNYRFFADQGKFSTDSVTVSRHLQQVSDSIYKGVLVCSPAFVKKPGKKTPAGSSVDFYVARRIQSFGKDTSRIWKVFLGDVHPLF